MARPVIGISTGWMSNQSSSLVYPVCYAGHDYVEAVLAAGGVPVLLGLHDPADPATAGVLERQFDLLDGLLITGGPDVGPLSYGEQPHPALGPTLPQRDRFDLALVAEADRRGLPVLAVCRGAQIVNVARGGTLYQDLPTQFGAPVLQHVQASDRHEVSHDVTVEPGTRLDRALGGLRRPRVTSFHHQAVKDVGQGLRVTARADDGVVEAVEPADAAAPWLVAVQWHPEMSHSVDSVALDLFCAFVAQAGAECS